MSWVDVLKLRNREVFTGKRTDPTFQRKKFKNQMKEPEVEVDYYEDESGTPYKRVRLDAKSEKKKKEMKE